MNVAETEHRISFTFRIDVGHAHVVECDVDRGGYALGLNVEIVVWPM